jgi:hypothetical protein
VTKLNLNPFPSKIFDSLKNHVEEGGRMLIYTNYKSKKGLKLIKQITKRKLKTKLKLKRKWNSIDIEYEKP